MSKIRGFFTKVIYSNLATGYTVVRFLLSDSIDQEIIVVGLLPKILEELEYELVGNYHQHPRFGMQFQIEELTPLFITEKNQIVSYLSSSLFIGIGKSTAEKIYQALGPNLIEKLSADPSLAQSIPSLTQKQKQSLINGLKDTADLVESYKLYSLVGLNHRLIYRIDKRYGNQAVIMITDNPYRLAYEIEGIGFKTADKIATKLGFDLDHPYRLEAAIVTLVIDLSVKNGDTYLLENFLKEKFLKEFPETDFDYYLDLAQEKELIFREADRIYHHSQYLSETFTASFLKQFPFSGLDKIKDKKILPLISELKQQLNIEYDSSQTQAILDFFKYDKIVMTGGPGTGKTTIVRAMVALFQKLYPNHSIALCAPTGRAAKRLSELTEAPAYTIHSLLGWDLETNTFRKNETDLLTIDLLIIDEFSMVDNWLFANLLKAGSLIKKMVLIGDDNQLPSVMPGNVLSDLITSELFHVISLTTIYRQKEGSGVIRLAHQIKEGLISDVSQFEDVRFLKLDNSQIKNQLAKIVEELLIKGYSLDDLIVLAPRYNFNLGIDDLNQFLQNICNPSDQFKKEIKIGIKVFKEGDKILQLKNQPDDDVYNGDIGILVEIDDSDPHNPSLIVDFDGNFVEYTSDGFQNITLAYCISIHKAQGNEYPIVVMPIIKSHTYMLNRQLLYTGVSRAKKALILLGNYQVFLDGVAKENVFLRNSSLLARLTGQL